MATPWCTTRTYRGAGGRFPAVCLLVYLCLFPISAPADAGRSAALAIYTRRMTSRVCKNCGVIAEPGEVTCTACGNVLPFSWSMLGLNDVALRKIGLTVLIPILVWKLMTALLG
jgi:hypothetical protein